MAATTTLSLKIILEPKSQKVLFAEAGKDFVDFLFSILSLPVGTVTRLVTAEGMAGSLGNLYDSIQNMDDNYMKRKANKDTLLKPMVFNYAVNPLMLSDQQSSTFPCDLYTCGGTDNHFNRYNVTYCKSHVASDSKSICPDCCGVMNRKASYVNPPKLQGSGKGGYVKAAAKFLIMDDLVVKPMSTTVSSVTMLKMFNVKDVGALEEKVINVGMNEGVELLKRSLQSKTVLTDVFVKF